MKASFQRFPKQKPDDFSSGYAGLAVRTGLEPATLGVTGRYSNQLNYRTNTLCGAKITLFFIPQNNLYEFNILKSSQSPVCVYCPIPSQSPVRFAQNFVRNDNSFLSGGRAALI
jgi:hypothetical protein